MNSNPISVVSYSTLMVSHLQILNFSLLIGAQQKFVIAWTVDVPMANEKEKDTSLFTFRT